MERILWQITLHPKTQRWYLRLPAGLPEDKIPAPEDIRSQARSQGIDTRRLLSDASLIRYLEKARENGGEEYAFPIVLEPTFDVRISLSPDKIVAKLYLRKAAEGTPVDMRLIASVIANSKLAIPDMDRVKADIEAFRQGPETELTDYVLAEGVPPGRGQDRELIPLVDWIPEEERAEIAPRAAKLIMTRGGPADLDPAKLQLAMVEADTIALSFTQTEPGPPGKDAQGNEVPGLPGNDPFVQSLYGASLGPQGVKTGRKGLMAVLEKAGVFHVWVFPHSDGRATVTITPDDLLATLILESEEGTGKPLTLELAQEAIRLKGLKGKIDEEAIAVGIREARSSKVKRELTILRGSAAVPAGCPKIEWKVPLTPDNPSVVVAKDTVILSWTIAKTHENGVNVFGAALNAAESKKPEIPRCDDTILAEPENPDSPERRLIALRAGELSFRDGTLSIKGTRKIENNIDESTGDVHFPGDLELVGNIAKGRSVRADGSLTMKGVAEACLLAANGVVFVDGGIKGAGSGTVWSKQTIDLTFAENARVLAGQDISIDKYCFQCIVKTNGRLLMKGNPGVLLGGSLQASRGAELFELGSIKTIRTSISFGQNYLVRDQINVCEKEALAIKETVKKLDAQMASIPNTDPRIHTLRQKKLELLKKNDKLTVRIFTLKEQFEAHVMSSVRVENTVWPGVILESHGRYYEVRERRNHVIFTFDQLTGQIVCNPIQDNPEEQ